MYCHQQHPKVDEFKGVPRKRLLLGPELALLPSTLSRSQGSAEAVRGNSCAEGQLDVCEQRPPRFDLGKAEGVESVI